MAEIVKQSTTIKKKATASKKKSSNEAVPDDESIVNSEYLEKVKVKRGRNKKKLQELGLLDRTPTPKKNESSDSNSKKQSGTTARKRILQSQKDETEKPRKKKNCPYDHTCYSTSYKEENDRRYLGIGFDLFGVKSQICSKKFEKDETENCITPSFAAPMYVCHGRGKHDCTHSICYQCYQKLFMEHSSTRRSRRKR